MCILIPSNINPISMAFLEYLVLLIIFFILVSILITIYTFQKRRTVVPTNWPILGMMPGVFVNLHRLNDYVTEVLTETCGTIMFKGPWLANLNMVVTADPLNIHHILSKNFSNYPRGEKVCKSFDVMGDGILTSDGKMWEIYHNFIFSILKHAGFQGMLETIIWDKVENALLPILESMCKHGTEIELQDIFQRFAFDNVAKLFMDNDPESLSPDFPYNPLLKAFTDGEEAIFLRQFTPPWLWKLQQTLKVGKEKKLSDAWKAIDQFIYKCLAQKLKEYNNMYHDTEKFTIFAAIMEQLQDNSGTSTDTTKFLRDTVITLMSAGKDTIVSALSWLFYMLARNPSVQDKIVEEIHAHLEVNADKRWNTKELDKLVYLHGALCESLRLYTPIPFNSKSPLQTEILPSGHQVDQNTNVILCFYSMGRMKSIWGEDCMDFKPERWISNNGGIKHEPSYKFTAFNAGPRACLGKNIALSQLKIVATAIILYYHTQLVEDQHVHPTESMVLMMKHGLKVRLNKRSGLN